MLYDTILDEFSSFKKIIKNSKVEKVTLIKKVIPKLYFNFEKKNLKFFFKFLCFLSEKNFQTNYPCKNKLKT